MVLGLKQTKPQQISLPSVLISTKQERQIDIWCDLIIKSSSGPLKIDQRVRLNSLEEKEIRSAKS